MTTFYLHEVQNLQSVKDGAKYSGTLFGAKQAATKGQAWQGTVLKISNEKGDIVAVKDTKSGKWFDPRNY